MVFSSSSVPRPRWLGVVLAALALVAIAGPLWLVLHAPRLPARPVQPHRATRIVPPAELPPVEPVAFAAITPDDARAWNASVPFVTGPNPAARPFQLGGDVEARARATDCLAAAMLYEAGDDPVGERAVGQVIINRARHPAFPKSICGVVFQGSERATGCQFTFTCDGAITRAPNPLSWARAQQLAAAALTGSVYAPVGHSTHYHTDWVVPYWSSSLDKVAEVHTHLFFRWTGWWGTPAAFRRTIDDAEPAIAILAPWSLAHARALALTGLADGPLPANAVLATLPGKVATAEPDVFLVTLDRKLPADRYAAYATATCGIREYCKFMAWADKAATPLTLPASPAQQSAMTFSYLRDRARGFEKALWNCGAIKRSDPRECMKGTLAVPVRPTGIARIEPVAPLALPAPRPTVRAALPVPPASFSLRPAATATPRTPPPAKP